MDFPQDLGASTYLGWSLRCCLDLPVLVADKTSNASERFVEEPLHLFPVHT